VTKGERKMTLNSVNFEEIVSVISSEFDSEFYKKQLNYDINIGPIQHYVQFGWENFLDPSPRFSTRFYLENYSDVKSMGVNPFYHYLVWGRKEGRKACYHEKEPLLSTHRALIAENFDSEFYFEKYSDHCKSKEEALEHFLSFGSAQGFNPCAWFSVSSYVTAYPDVANSEMNPFLHYLLFGKNEGRHIYNEELQNIQEKNNEDISNLEEGEDGCRILTEYNSENFNDIMEHFDEQYYISQNPNIPFNQGAFYHYMNFGWKDNLDPSPFFSTKYYLQVNQDIQSAGINPFVHYIRHGRRERRSAIPYLVAASMKKFDRKVSVVVPNYNHAEFLDVRLNSISNQSYKNIEIIILDDASSDNSRSIIDNFVEKNSHLDIKVIFNEKNSGNVFRQWKKGIEASSADFVWICESDDYCEYNFLEEALKGFVDDSIMISFGNIQFCDYDGNVLSGLDGYRESACSGIWESNFVKPAASLFSEGFFLANLIPNVGGCVFRKVQVTNAVWDTLEHYRICGDWYLYCYISAGGQFAFNRKAISYFRQHKRNTSVSSFVEPYFYKEHEDVLHYIKSKWDVPEEIIVQSYLRLLKHFRYSGADNKIRSLSDVFDLTSLLKAPKTKPHILICSLGFTLGGGEIFPIHLSNALIEHGYTVSFMCLESDQTTLRVRSMLNRNIPVYESRFIEDYGADKFIADFGVDYIHSHCIGVEFFFFGRCKYRPTVPYIVTLHGSYEVTPLTDSFLLTIVRSVDHWVYLSEKNLQHLKGIPISEKKITKIGNFMPLTDRESEVSRQDLLIDDDAIVVTIASRALASKGWREAIKAIEIIRASYGIDIHIVLCGTGEIYDEILKRYETIPFVHVLGFQDNVPAIYRMSDIAMLPSRFMGESYPLTIIEAMQAGVPVIATDIGDIPNIIQEDGLYGGILIPYNVSDEEMVSNIVGALSAMISTDVREKFSLSALKISDRFSVQKGIAQYLEVYRRYKICSGN
jgi:glycosyltransferase involved in cell wall biosynthesis